MHYGRLLRNRNFIFFLLNCACGSLGQGFTYISLAWLSQGGGSSLSAMALVMFGFWAPCVALALPIGNFIDRGYDRAAAMLANGMRGLVLILLVCTQGHILFNKYQIFALALILGIFNAFYGPAIGVIIRKIVPEGDLLYANSLGDGFVEFFSIIGMGMSGFIMILIGSKYVMLLSGILFIAAALCFVFFKLDKASYMNNQPKHYKKIIWPELLKTPGLIATYTMSGILFFLLMAVPVLLAPFVKTLPAATLKDFSLLEASFSSGAVLGAFIVPYFVNKYSVRSLYTFWTLLAGALLCFAFFSGSPLWFFFYLIIGMCIATWAVVHTELQKITPLEYQGRLLAYNNSFWGTLVFVTFFLSNIFGDYLNIRVLYVSFSILVLLLIIIYYSTKNLFLKRL